MGGMYSTPQPPVLQAVLRDGVVPPDYGMLALDVKCPVCHAPAGRPCRDLFLKRMRWSRRPVVKPHKARRSRAAFKHQP